MGNLLISAIDREDGTFTLAALNDDEEAFLEGKRQQFDTMYERLARDVSVYLFRNGDAIDNFEVGQSIALNPIELGFDRTAEPVRLVGCNLGAAGPMSAAVIAVVGSMAALEWLRQRKAAVAAAEGNEEAYRSLLSDFIVWLTALFAKMRTHGGGT